MTNIRVNFFYIDALENGGAPDDFRSLFLSLPEKLRGQVFARLKAATPERPSFPAKAHRHLGRLVEHIFIKRAPLRRDRNLIIGGMIWQNFVIAFIFRLLRINYDILPFSHTAKYAVANKIFSASPIISNGSLAKSNRLPNLRKLKVSIKKLLFHTIVRRMLLSANAIWVASEFEKQDLCGSFSDLQNSTWVYFNLGINTVSGRKTEYRFEGFNQNLNLVFWGRVDYVHKGLDRIVAAVALQRDFFRDHSTIFHILGPSYNKGKQAITKRVTELGIRDLFSIPDDEQIKGIDLGGLVNSDGMLFLTRWEGHPRAVREALFFGVPTLVSPESHFGDRNHSALERVGGMCSCNPDNAEEVLSDLKRFINNLENSSPGRKRDPGMIDNTKEPLVSWSSISEKILSQIF